MLQAPMATASMSMRGLKQLKAQNEVICAQMLPDSVLCSASF